MEKLYKLNFIYIIFNKTLCTYLNITLRDFSNISNTMNKDEVPKKQKGKPVKVITYYNQDQTKRVKTPSFLGHLDPDIVFLIKNKYLFLFY